MAFVRNLYEEERKNEDLLEQRRLQFANHRNSRSRAYVLYDDVEFCCFNMTSRNKIQLTDPPWVILLICYSTN